MNKFEVNFETNNSYYIDNPVMFLKLKMLIENDVKLFTRTIYRKDNVELLNWINDSVPLLQDKKFKLSTKCYWIIYNIHKFPQCLNCGRDINDKNIMTFERGYGKYCSQKCQLTSKEFKEQRIQTWRKNYNDNSITSPTQVFSIREKQKQTCRKNHGVDYPMQNHEIFHKGQDSKQQKYGDKNYVNPDKAKQTKTTKYGDAGYRNVDQARQTCIELYGVDNYAKTKEYLDKCEQRSLEKYGTVSPNSSEIVKQHKIEGIKRIYGEQYTNIFQVPEIKKKIDDTRKQAIQKAIETKRKNGTFNTSKQEEDAYHILHFMYPRLIRQYKSEQYPFACDFYDPVSKTYIECNFSWTHGGHWFDVSNADDVARVERMKAKNSKYYDNAIETWTVRDVNKRACAEKNHLNYAVFWNLEEVRKYVLDELQKHA